MSRSPRAPATPLLDVQVGQPPDNATSSPADQGRRRPKGFSPLLDPAYRLALVGLVGLAFALRAYHLAAQCLWSDEDITLDRAMLPVADLLARLPVEHAPLYFVMMRGWTRLAGSSDLALRFPSLAAGVLAVALAAYVGACLAGRRVALILALIAAVNPFLVWYGQEARMYTLVQALALAALSFVLHAQGKRGADAGQAAWRWWVAAGVATAAALYTHYYAALLVLVMACWTLLDAAVWIRPRSTTGRPPSWTGWVLTGLTTAVLFAPWLPRALALLSFPGWRQPQPLTRLTWQSLAAWSAGTTVEPAAAGAITGLYLLLASLGLAALMRRAWRGGRGSRLPLAGPRSDTAGVGGDRWPGGSSLEARPTEACSPSARRGALRALTYLLVPFAALGLLWWRTADFHPRYAMAVLPAYYLAVAVGVGLWRGKLRAAVTGLLLLAAAVPLANLYHDPAFQKQDYRGFLRMVEAAAGREDTVLLLDGPSYGLSRRYETAGSPVKLVNLQSSANRRRTEGQLTALLASLAAEYPHLWLATDGAARGLARPWLKRHACPVGSHSFQDTTLERYLAPQALPPARRPLAGAPWRCPDGQPGRAPGECRPVALQLAAPRSVQAGQVLAAQLTWLARQPLTTELKVSLRLLPLPGDQPLAAVDRPAAGGRPADTWPRNRPVTSCHGLLVPADLSPGRYRLQVILYEPASLRQLAAWSGQVLTIQRVPVGGAEVQPGGRNRPAGSIASLPQVNASAKRIGASPPPRICAANDLRRIPVASNLPQHPASGVEDGR